MMGGETNEPPLYTFPFTMLPNRKTLEKYRTKKNTKETEEVSKIRVRLLPTAIISVRSPPHDSQNGATSSCSPLTVPIGMQPKPTNLKGLLSPD